MVDEKNSDTIYSTSLIRNLLVWNLANPDKMAKWKEEGYVSRIRGDKKEDDLLRIRTSLNQHNFINKHALSTMPTEEETKRAHKIHSIRRER